MWKLNLGGGSKSVADAAENTSAVPESQVMGVEALKSSISGKSLSESHADPAVGNDLLSDNVISAASLAPERVEAPASITVAARKSNLGEAAQDLKPVIAVRKSEKKGKIEEEEVDTSLNAKGEENNDDEEEEDDDIVEEEDDDEDGDDPFSESSGSCNSDSDSEGREAAKRYPIFSSHYAEQCNYGMVPFLREETKRIPTTSTSALSGFSRVDPPNSDLKQLVIYGQYVYEKTLGKGTYSKVVLARLLPTASPNAKDSSFLEDDENGAVTSSASVGESFCSSLKVHGSKVALKIFRDKESYREACWDEMVILSLLCGLPGVPTMNTNGGVSAGGMAEYVASLARFVAPISYIPHPLHPALVLPLLGPSTFAVCRQIKMSSRDIAEKENYDVRKSPQNKPAIFYRGLPLPLLKSVLYQVLIFLQYSHSKGIVHTDLKPENVLFETVVSNPTLIPIYYQEIKRLDHDDDQKVNNSKSDDERSGPGKKSAAEENEEAPQKAMARNEASSLRENSRYAEDVDSKYPFFSPFSRDGSSSEVRFAHNIVVEMPMLPSIRVVDLGAAQLVSRFRHISRIDRVTPVSYDRIQTKHYISPEVLLCTGWTASADIFSLGCMIPELLTGDCLFMPQHRVEHLALMENIIGPFSEEDTTNYREKRRFIDDAFICNPQNTEIEFDTKTNQLHWPLTKRVLDLRAELVALYESGYNTSGHASESEVEVTTAEDIKFVKSRPSLEEILGPIPQLHDLAKKMLIYHPLERISASEALKHPFFHTM